jgi:hypothetical protein
MARIAPRDLFHTGASDRSAGVSDSRHEDPDCALRASMDVPYRREDR